ncbi:MAG: hypothetical protein V3V67_10415 [Myxococcota bacterium]
MVRGRRLRVEQLAARLRGLSPAQLGQLEHGVGILRQLEREPGGAD